MGLVVDSFRGPIALRVVTKLQVAIASQLEACLHLTKVVDRGIEKFVMQQMKTERADECFIKNN